MSRVLTFSREFPKYHPKAGEPTFFVEKIYKSLYLMKCVPKEIVEAFNFEIMNDDAVAPKHHTIRAGNRWKVGDKFSPRVWSGKPYASKQIIIAPDIEVKKVWDFEVSDYEFLINNEIFYHQHVSRFHDHIEALAKNDGLLCKDMFDWFKIPSNFTGQIICWNESINY